MIQNDYVEKQIKYKKVFRSRKFVFCNFHWDGPSQSYLVFNKILPSMLLLVGTYELRKNYDLGRYVFHGLYYNIRLLFFTDKYLPQWISTSTIQHYCISDVISLEYYRRDLVVFMVHDTGPAAQQVVKHLMPTQQIFDPILEQFEPL